MARLVRWSLALSIPWTSDGSDNITQPLFFWVSPETKQSLQELSGREGPVEELFARWVDLRWALLRSDGPKAEVAQLDDRVSTLGPASGAPVSAQDAFETLSEEQQRRLLLGLPRGKLEAVGGKAKRAILTWTTGEPHFVDLAENLGLSIQQNAAHLSEHFCVVSLDATADAALQERGICSIRYDLPEHSPKQAQRWDFKKRLLCTGLLAGLETLVLDADSVLLGDPFQHAVSGDADLETGTDHFFPERDLWQPYSRPEEHINTGFLYANGTRGGGRLLCFLGEFLDVFQATDWLALPRDFFDQRAFNKFVIAHLSLSPSRVETMYRNRTMGLAGNWTADRLAVSGMLATRPPLGGLCDQIKDRPLTIRILDPEEVAHGMNFFWRNTHLRRPSQRPPVFVHANGVDDKVYFMRDRGIWYIDDWDKRFRGGEPRFLRYHHPSGLSLQEDFATLFAALDVAKILGRRLVLPRTMNCRNSPAYEAYSLPMVDCTVDHFASAKILLHYHNESLVEASLIGHHRFRSLEAASLHRVGDDGAVAVAERLQDAPSSSASVLVLELDVRSARDALHAVAQGSSSVAKATHAGFQCKYAYWPGRQMACRDEAFVRVMGEHRRCGPLLGQQGCGVRGFSCCEVFHGWAEKLEFFTGRPWDLPCNCGLDDYCKEFVRTDDYPQLTENHRCCHLRDEDPPMLHCFDIGSFPPINPPMDFNSYSADALWAFDQGLLTPQEVFDACKRWTEAASVSMGLSTRPHDMGKDCTWIVSTFLVERENHDRLTDWLDFMLRNVRRPLWVHGVTTLPMIGSQADDGSYSLWKLHHDMAQLDFLLREGPGRGLRSLSAENATLPWVRQELLPRYAALFEGTQQGLPREELHGRFRALHGVYNRALHVVSPRLPLGESALAAGSIDALRRAENILTRGGHVAVVDGLLTEEALQELQWALQASTIWFSSPLGAERVMLTASLLDGLHGPLLLQLSREVREHMPTLMTSPLRDIVARRHHASTRPSPGAGVHALDAEVVACLWALPSREPHALGAVGGGLRVYNTTAPDDWSEEQAFGWPADAATDARKAEALGAGTPWAAAAEVVDPLANRVAIWRGRQLVESEPMEAWPEQYEDGRVEVYLLFGSQRRWERHS